MGKLVTVAVPIYKRLEYLPKVLKVVEAQSYPHVELLVSDNGMNGDVVRDRVAAAYRRRYAFRQNPQSVSIAQHYNQMVHAAAGDYLVILPDDDEISPHFVAQLVARFDQHPDASVGFGRQEFVDATGHVLGQSAESLPESMSGPDFIMATWRHYSFGFQTVTTFLAKTEAVRACGGFPDFPRGTHIDDALVIKLCLTGRVVFSSASTYRNLVDASSTGWSVSFEQLAAAVRQFMRFVDHDPTTKAFAASHPTKWPALRGCLVEMSWRMYLWRWRDIYRRRLSFLQWIRAGFAIPFIPAYYRSALQEMIAPLPASRAAGISSSSPKATSPARPRS